MSSSELFVVEKGHEKASNERNIYKQRPYRYHDKTETDEIEFANSYKYLIFSSVKQFSGHSKNSPINLQDTIYHIHAFHKQLPILRAFTYYLLSIKIKKPFFSCIMKLLKLYWA